jgi:hypothetical protein
VVCWGDEVMRAAHSWNEVSRGEKTDGGALPTRRHTRDAATSLVPGIWLVAPQRREGGSFFGVWVISAPPPRSDHTPRHRRSQTDQRVRGRLRHHLKLEVIDAEQWLRIGIIQITPANPEILVRGDA